MAQRRSIIQHPHDFAGAPQILSPPEEFGERFDPSFLSNVNGSTGGSAEDDQYGGAPSPSRNVRRGPHDSSSASAASSPAMHGGGFDLVPQRSAPPPPGGGGAYVNRQASGRTSGGASGSSYSPGRRPSRPNVGIASTSSSSLGPANGNMSAVPGSSNYVRGPGAAPPRPLRSQTHDATSDFRSIPGVGPVYGQDGSGSGSASGFLPSGARSHASIGGPASSPTLVGSQSQFGQQSPALSEGNYWSSGLQSSLEESTGGAHSATTIPGAAPQAPSARGTRSEFTQAGGGRNTLKSVFGGFVNSMSDVFTQQKKIEISTPYDPVHLTHVGFNSDTGEFTGLPKEWQTLLQNSGISKEDQAANPQAVMDIVAFYQDATQHAEEDDAVWKKFGGAANTATHASGNSGSDSRSGTTENSPIVRTHEGFYEKPRAAPVPPGLAPGLTGQSSMRKSSRPPPTEKPLTAAPAADKMKPSRPAPTGPSSSGVMGGGSSPVMQQDKTPKAPSSPPQQHKAAAPVTLPGVTPSGNKGKSEGLTSKPSQGKPPPGATPRRRDTKKSGMKDHEVIEKLKTICTDADPTKLYRDFEKIGAGASGGVFTAYQVGTNVSVAIKQMNLEQQPKKDLIINEILVMKESKHRNIVNYIDSFLHKGDLWVVMEFMEGGSLTDVVTCNVMSEPQIAAVCMEVLEGLRHLHANQVIHRDIKSDNVLLSMHGDIKLSE